MGPRAHSNFFFLTAKFFFLFSFYLPPEYINLFAFSEHQSWHCRGTQARRILTSLELFKSAPGGPETGRYDISHMTPVALLQDRAGAGPNESYVIVRLNSSINSSVIIWEFTCFLLAEPSVIKVNVHKSIVFYWL